MINFLLQQAESPAKSWAEYGALGVLVLALIWLLQLILTRLPAIIENNTKAMVELKTTLEGKVVNCPLSADPTIRPWLVAWMEHAVEQKEAHRGKKS